MNKATTEDSWGTVRSIAYIVNAIIGIGIFIMPNLLAELGYNAVVGLFVSGIVSIILGLTFIQLGKSEKNFNSLIDYISSKLGRFCGYLAGWGYWFAVWLGNAVILVTWASYFFALFAHSASKLTYFLFDNLALWLIFFISATKVIGKFQIIISIGKLLPLLIVSIVGLFYIKQVNVDHLLHAAPIRLNPSAKAAAFVLFNYLGIETLIVHYKNMKKKASIIFMISLLICMVIYILGIISVYGTLSYDVLSNSKTPFIDSGNRISSVVGRLIGISVFLSGIGTLITWSDMAAIMPRQIKGTNMIPRAMLNYRFSLLVSNILTLLVVAVALVKFSFIDIVVDITVFVTVVFYILILASYLKTHLNSVMGIISLLLSLAMLLCIRGVGFISGIASIAAIVAIYFLHRNIINLKNRKM